MGAHPVSLIIVSRHRIAALQRAVTAIGQQDHPAVELIVVADPKACDALAGLGLRAKIIPFDQANIAVARNLGLTRAAGQVVAFIDDDAVPEPTWLSRLVAPFVDPMVVAATGFVRGRNGISFQWRACEVDACGFDHPLDVGDTVSLHAGNQQRAVKTHGTNCAFRRDALLAAGGFDAGFRFYLDEADVNLRMASAGLTAVVPLAQVHHGFAASARRRADRVPLSMYENGASSMVFLRRHAAKMDWPAACARLRTEQRHRLLRLMVSGGIEPRDLPRLMQTLDAGLIDGALRALVTLPPLA
ncbi:MAG: glycosyltransferase family 2 protein, partial [Paracoccaceae bacterium]|nr:glycosyltransferase family 2 protein [Paracoccaceae bacterium]